MRVAANNRIGVRFGRLVVASIIRRSYKNTLAVVVCDCGNKKRVVISNLVRGHTKSCGCLSIESLIKRSTKHNMTPIYKPAPREYRSWAAMKSRCHSKTNAAYKYYGARGIRVCKRWRNSFKNFLKDMGPRPYGKSLGRIDNNKSYERRNCRWETSRQQQQNKRNIMLLEKNGITKTASQWSRYLGMNKCAVSIRLSRGWSIERSLIPPTRKTGRYVSRKID